MPARKMLTRRQCVVVIVVLPSLIIPAFMILKMADNKPGDDLFMLPKNVPVPGVEDVMRKAANLSSVRALNKSKKPRKCFDYIWSGTCHDTCHKFNTQAKQRQRKQTVFTCDKKKTQLRTLYTTKPKFVYKIPYKDQCLRKVVDWYCKDSKSVPNIVHYVWFGKNDFKFIHFLSFLSAHRIQNPCLILVHADRLPKGQLWRYFLQISPKIIHVQRKPPKKIFKKKLTFVEHKADVAKLEALREYGGIYLDTDQVLLKPLNDFRNYDVTIGLEYDRSIANSIIIARKNALFLKYWYESYRSYSKLDGNKHSNELPYKLAKKYSELVHVAGTSLATPHAKQLPLIYSKNIDWSKHYGMHLHAKLYERFYGNLFTLDSMRTLNTTAGAIARYIVYDNADLCKAKDSSH